MADSSILGNLHVVYRAGATAMVMDEWRRESLENTPVAAPDFITVGEAFSAERRGIPWPIDGDATSRLRDYPERRVK